MWPLHKDELHVEIILIYKYISLVCLNADLSSILLNFFAADQWLVGGGLVSNQNRHFLELQEWLLINQMASSSLPG